MFSAQLPSSGAAGAGAGAAGSAGAASGGSGADGGAGTGSAGGGASGAAGALATAGASGSAASGAGGAAGGAAGAGGALDCSPACEGGKECVKRTVDQGGSYCACAIGMSFCNNACVSLQSDPTNCGDCGVACAGGKICSYGKCVDQCASPCGVGGTCGTVNDSCGKPVNCGTCSDARSYCTSAKACDVIADPTICADIEGLKGVICVDFPNPNAPHTDWRYWCSAAPPAAAGCQATASGCWKCNGAL